MNGPEASRVPMAHPWQDITRGSGLMLHAALCEPVALPPLQPEYARLDAAVGPELRTFLNADRSWSGLALIERRVTGGQDGPPPGTPTAALAYMPTVQALLARMGWDPVSVYLLRQPPRGILPWHFDNQALHLTECRLLLPIHAPAGAVTLIGHETAAYPAGTLWTADFSFPHQVENPTGQARVVLAIDLRCTDALRRNLPPALAAAADRRRPLAQLAQAQMLRWRATRDAPERLGDRHGPLDLASAAHDPGRRHLAGRHPVSVSN